MHLRVVFVFAKFHLCARELAQQQPNYDPTHRSRNPHTAAEGSELEAERRSGVRAARARSMIDRPCARACCLLVRDVPTP